MLSATDKGFVALGNTVRANSINAYASPLRLWIAPPHAKHIPDCVGVWSVHSHGTAIALRHLEQVTASSRNVHDSRLRLIEPGCDPRQNGDTPPRELTRAAL